MKKRRAKAATISLITPISILLAGRFVLTRLASASRHAVAHADQKSNHEPDEHLDHFDFSFDWICSSARALVTVMLPKAKSGRAPDATLPAPEVRAEQRLQRRPD
jgi:hypothetical protein